ncbi:MAG: cupin domain-containing protein [Rhizobiales bacterium]|nr:cupin domain-containing protein [Hyphomicrobiales bacterium]
MSSDDDADDFVLGSVRAGQRDVVARKRLYLRDLDRRICAFEDLLSGLKPVEDEGTPRPDLWDQICDKVAHQPNGDSGYFANGSFACLDGTWEHHGPGIECKTLWSDKALLIRCEPGATEACHPQPEDEDEHVIIIAGDLVIGGRTLVAGDYLQIPAAALHPEMYTLTGCLIFTQYEPAIRC